MKVLFTKIAAILGITFLTKKSKMAINPFKWQIETLLLLLINSIPLFGAMLLGWDINQIIVFYWIETGIAGYINILKLVFLNPENVIKYFHVPLFLVHFSGSWLFMGYTLKTILNVDKLILEDASGLYALILINLSIFLYYFLYKRGYTKTNLNQIFQSTYINLFLTFITVIVGGFIFDVVNTLVIALNYYLNTEILKSSDSQVWTRIYALLFMMARTIEELIIKYDRFGIQNNYYKGTNPYYNPDWSEQSREKIENYTDVYQDNPSNVKWTGAYYLEAIVSFFIWSSAIVVVTIIATRL